MTTTLVDCGQHAELIHPGEANSTFLSDPGWTRSQAEWNVCLKIESNVQGFDLTLYACASDSRREKHRFKCNTAHFGDGPWSAGGMVDESRSGLVTTSTFCCNDADGCNTPPTIETAAPLLAVPFQHHVRGTGQLVVHQRR